MYGIWLQHMLYIWWKLIELCGPVYLQMFFSDMAELQGRVDRILLNLGLEKTILVNRADIYRSVLDAYTVDSSLCHHRLKVVFLGEEIAEDHRGLTREMFCLFFTAMYSCVFSGRAAKVPSDDIRNFFDGTYEVIGRVMAHAFVLVNIFPVRLAQAPLISMLTDKVNDAQFVQTFLDYLGENEAKTIRCRHIEQLRWLQCTEGLDLWPDCHYYCKGGAVG
jgi:hypothetical protein